MSSANVEIVRRAYAAWNAGDYEDAAAMMAPEVEWRLPQNLPDADTWSGASAVRDGLERFLGSWEEFRVEVQELIDEGERVVALVRFHGRAALTGLTLTGVSVDTQVWTLRDGMVVRLEMYGGTEPLPER
jgi:ketosteroid isomerase-like protein